MALRQEGQETIRHRPATAMLPMLQVPSQSLVRCWVLGHLVLSVPFFVHNKASLQPN